MLTQHHPTPITETDIRTESWEEFADTLRCYNQRLQLRLHRKDPSAYGRKLQQDLLLPTSEVHALCRMTSRHYGITWCEVDTAQIALHDSTVGDLHRRLWHRANQVSEQWLEYQRR